MSRIQDILKKAERDGAVHRTRALAAPEPASALQRLCQQKRAKTANYAEMAAYLLSDSLKF